MPAKKSYTVREAAKALGVSRQAVHHAIKKGYLEARQGEVVAVEWLIPVESVKAYRSRLRKSAGKKTEKHLTVK